MPATTNQIENTNARLRQMLRDHRAMGLTRRMKAVFWWCYTHSAHPRLGRRNMLQRTPPHHPLPQHLGLTPSNTFYPITLEFQRFGASRKMTAINYVRNLAGGGVGAARFGRPRRELRSARRLVVQPGPAAHGCRGRALRTLRRPPRRWRWGFCSIRSWLSACRRRVVVLMTPFPPFGGGEITV